MKFFKFPGIVAIGIHNDCLEFGYFGKQKENFFELKSYKCKNLDKFEIFDSIIFNQVLVQSYIQDFFIEHNIYKPHVYLYLSKSQRVKECIIVHSSANCSKRELDIDDDGAFIWLFDYLGSENDLHYYYVVGIAQELLFQYKLLISMLPCLLIKIVTNNLALLNAKRNLRGNILDLKNLNIENLSNSLVLPRYEKFILSNEMKTSQDFLLICFGMLV